MNIEADGALLLVIEYEWLVEKPADQVKLQ